jgi:CRP-like cAMP-binding protein
VVRAGEVRVLRELGDREVVVAIVGPGGLVGEDGLVGPVYTTTSVALEPTETIALDTATFEAMVAEDPTLAIRLVRALVEKVDAAHERVALLARPGAARLAETLARLASTIGRPDPEGTLIPRRLRELAHEVGLDEAALGEASMALVRERLLRVRKHGIVVPDARCMYDFVKSADAVPTTIRGATSVRTDGA